MPTEHRILKIGERFQLQYRRTLLFGFHTTRWTSYVDALLELPADHPSIEKAIAAARDYLSKGEVIPISETVKVA